MDFTAYGLHRDHQPQYFSCLNRILIYLSLILNPDLHRRFYEGDET